MTAKQGQPTINVQVKSFVWLFFWTVKVTNRQRSDKVWLTSLPTAKTQIRAIMDKYRKNKVFSIPYTGTKGETKYRVFYNEGFKRKTDLQRSKCDNLPYLFKTPSSSLAERLIERRCELCGQQGKVVMHHVRKLSLLKGNNEWEQKMKKMRRKTLAVCEKCNSKIKSCNS